MSWADGDVVKAAFRGFEFYALTTDDRIERRIVEHEVPYKDGAELEDLGRKARPTRLTALFFGPTGATDLGTFLGLAAAGQVGTLRHPTQGQWRARIVSLSVRQAASKRDASEIDVDFREHGQNQTVPTVFAVKTEAAELGDKIADARLTADMTAGTVPDSVEKGLVDADELADDMQANAQDLTNRLGQTVVVLNAAVGDVYRDLDNVEAWPLANSLRLVALAAVRVKRRIDALSPQIKIESFPQPVTLAKLASLRYGDATRAEDLRQVNKIRNTFLAPADRLLKVYTS